MCATSTEKGLEKREKGEEKEKKEYKRGDVHGDVQACGEAKKQ